MKIKLNPVKCSDEVMQLLEEKEVITRLTPGRHRLEVSENTSRHETLYASQEKFGPHKLICVTINAQDFSRFLYHNDHEEFMLIDEMSATPLYILFSLLRADELNKKINQNTLTSEDFLLVEMKKNDPNLSFFTMHKGFAHVELCKEISENPPSFYVAESRDIDENIIDMKHYMFEIKETL